MLMPSLLPESLSIYQTAENDEQLFSMLVKNPLDMLSFFTLSCDDETWCNEHSEFSNEALKWITEQFYHRNLLIDLVVPVAAAVREHFQNLEKWLPLDIIIMLSDRTVSINSLLFQTASFYWYRLIQSNCLEKDRIYFTLPNFNYADFMILKEYIYTGRVKELYRLNEPDILRISHLARGSELKVLENECEELLLRYITADNLLKYMVISEDHSLDLVKTRCCQIFNSLYDSVIIDALNSQELTCELTVSTEASLDLFAKLIPHVTHFIPREYVMDDPNVIALLQRCSKLISLDLGRTLAFSENILLFSHLKELIFAGCSWLSDLYFKRVCANFSKLQKLDLTSCSKITSAGWGELAKLSRLFSLSLERCEALTNEDFALILLSARQLRELKMSECRNLTDAAFHTLATSQQKFVRLDLGRTAIEDRGLLEITSRINSLSYLDLTRCQNLSEKGIVDAIKVSSLLEVDLSHTNISESALEEIRKLRPSLRIIN